MNREGKGPDRFLDRGDPRNQRRRAYERKSKFFKRQRNQAKQTSEQRIVRILLQLDTPPDQFEKNIGNVINELRTLINDQPEKVAECLIDCLIELPTRTPQFSTLIGLLYKEGSGRVVDIVKRIQAMLMNAIKKAEVIRARMLTRSLVGLVTSRVLSPTSVLNFLTDMIDSATSISGKSEDKTGRSWQPYTDFLTAITLISLPWGGGSIFGESADQWMQFAEKVEGYIESRPIQRDASISPFLAPTKDSDDAAQSDSGGASFVRDLWFAIKELQANNWQIGTVPSIFNPKIMSNEAFDLDQIDLPEQPPFIDGLSVQQAAVELNRVFLPRGGIQLLEPQHTHPNSTEIDRIVVEEYILDSICIYQSSRVDVLKRITQDIQAPFPVHSLVAQTLFSQLLALPRPRLSPVAYSAVIISLCKVGDEEWSVFPRGLSGCVREVFSRMNVIDPELFDRMADWLSLHLSNLSFMWPWHKWKKVAEAPDDNSQKIFVKIVLRKLVELSYHQRVQESLSCEEFHPLLPPESGMKSFDEVFQSKATKEKDPDSMDIEDDESKQAAKFRRLRDLVLSKTESLLMQQIISEEFPDQPSDPKDYLKGFVRVLLMCGDKNLTHTKTVLTRYQSLIETAMAAVDEGIREEIMIDAATDVWSSSIHRLCLVVGLMMDRGMASPVAVVRWAMSRLSGVDRGSVDEIDLWVVLEIGMRFGEATVKAAEKGRSDAAARVQEAKENAQEAANKAAEAASRLEAGDVEEVQDTIDEIDEANRAEEFARREVTESETLLQSATNERIPEVYQKYRVIFFEVLRGYLALLDSRSRMSSEDPGKEFSVVLSRFGAFCRRYGQRVVDHVDEIEGLIGEKGEAVRGVVINSLRVGRI